MELILVQSTTIAAAGYDTAAAVLKIRFTSGAVYRYFQVPEHVYTAFMAAKSQGSFFNRFIRPKYRYEESD